MINRSRRTYGQDFHYEIARFRSAARDNIRKFMEKYLYIRTKRGTLSPLRFNPVQDYYWQTVESTLREQRPLRKIYLKYRQVGWSTLWSGFIFANAYNRDNIDALVVAHLRERTTKLFQMHRLFLECLPTELQLPLERSSKQELIWQLSRSSIALATAGTTAAGRGGTVQFVHASEAAYYPHLFEFLGALQQAVPDIPESAVILETTANGTGNEFHALWNAAIAGEVGFEPHFVEWMRDPECSLPFPNINAREEFLASLDNDLRERMLHYNLSAEQINWYQRTLITKCQGDEVLMQQEYPCDPTEAFISSGTPIFPPKLTERYRMMCRPGKLYDPTIVFTSMDDLVEAPDLVRNKDVYLEIWKPPRPGNHYLISADCSEGLVGGDYSCAYVFDIYSLDMCAELHGLLDPDQFARILARLGNLYNGALLAPETHGAGLSVLNILKDIYWNIYQWRILDGYGFKITNRLGWETNVHSRAVMLTEAKRVYRARVEDPDFIPSLALIDEIRTFVMSNLASKPIAASGCHDDRVMAWAIGIITSLQELASSPLGMTYTNDHIPSPADDSNLSVKDLLNAIKRPDFFGHIPSPNDLPHKTHINYEE